MQVIHDAFDRHGAPIPFSPRNVLRRVVDMYHKRGMTPVIAPEMEFFLVARNLDPAHEIKPMMGRSGRPAAARQAYSMTAVDEFGPVIDDIYDFAEAQGFEIDGITQEGGAGQLEINLRHGDPIKLADEVFYFKRLIREAALRHDCFATFMAKPIADEPGSAMHIHHSFLDSETGRNLFAGTAGRRDGRVFPLHRRIAETPALGDRDPGTVCQFLSPLRQGSRRPINLAWGRDNRTTGIRVPLSGPEARRVENRMAGMDCNPYLCIAASLACGLLGIINEDWPDKQFKGDAYAGERTFPA